ncbi:MAG TPA: DUF4382 domain-containing protein [Geobacterales bacterium]|nr:DUF4382 domain-containing protein [Geobacterales bacterium]
MKRAISIAIAVIVIVAISTIAYVELMNMQGPTSPSSTSSQTSGTTSQTTTATGGGQVSYNFAVFMTDPPITPPNVTAIYLSYQNILIHKEEGDNWISLNQSGELELMGLVNFTQMISLAKLPEGDYNLLRFINASAIVTYENKNYTAKVPSGEVLVRIEPPLSLKANATAALVVDLAPRIVFAGGNDTSFMLVPYAKAIQVSNVTEIIGNQKIEDVFKMHIKISLRNTTIFPKLITLREFEKIEILNVTISSNGFNVTIKNISNTTVDLKLLILAAKIPLISPTVIQNVFPDLMFMAFKITQNGSLELLSNVNSTILLNILINGTGLNLQPNETATLSYHGQIQFNFVIKHEDGKVETPIMEFQRGIVYVVTILGDPEVYARAIVLVK